MSPSLSASTQSVSPFAAQMSGVYTAVVTPFTTSLEIDWSKFDQLLEMQVAGGVAGVVISGTTGESPTLTVQEKLSLIKRARAVCGRRCQVMAGSGGNNTAQSAELSKLAEDAGADSLLVVTPYYNKPTYAGLKHHYAQIMASVKIPICLYHVPSRTGQFLNVDQITNLCLELAIPAIKEASGDIGYFSRVTHKLPATSLLSGDDASFMASMAVGGRGVISVISNIFPKATVELYKAMENQQLQRAQSLNKRLLPLMDLTMVESNPGPIKAMLSIKGLIKNTVRAPLAPVTEQSFQRLQEALQHDSDLQ